MSARWAQMPDQLGIADLASRRPHQLSGGQAQPVAMARALSSRLGFPPGRAAFGPGPADSTGNPAELCALLTRLTCVTVYVTHNPIEAMVFGDQVGVLERGKSEQSGVVPILNYLTASRNTTVQT